MHSWWELLLDVYTGIYAYTCTCTCTCIYTLDKLANFSWDDLASELKNRAPVLHTFLTTCVDVKRRRKTSKTTYRTSNAAVLGVCASILLRHKNQHMNVLQHIVSLILHRGHAGKQVNVTCAYIQMMPNCLPLWCFTGLSQATETYVMPVPQTHKFSFGFPWQGLRQGSPGMEKYTPNCDGMYMYMYDCVVWY